MSRAIPKIAIDFLAHVEECRLVAYQDSKLVWTIGIGHTGPEVKRGLTITRAVADQMLADDLKIAARRLALKVNETRLDSLDEHQYAALLSFVFNLGIADWTIWKTINAGKLNEVPAQLMRFNKIKTDSGRVITLPGLTNRRAAEVALWNTPDLMTAVSIATLPGTILPPSSETRAAETPPTELPSKPLGGASLATKAVGLVTATGAAATQINQLVSPHSDIELYAKVSAVLIGVIIVCGVIALFISHRQEASRHQ
jgi:lysozyme